MNPEPWRKPAAQEPRHTLYALRDRFQSRNFRNSEEICFRSPRKVTISHGSTGSSRYRRSSKPIATWNLISRSGQSWSRFDTSSAAGLPPGNSSYLHQLISEGKNRNTEFLEPGSSPLVFKDREKFSLFRIKCKLHDSVTVRYKVAVVELLFELDCILSKHHYELLSRLKLSIHGRKS
jgi:hypothetical protein